MSRYVLKFIGGKYEGGEVALPDAGEVGIGRAQELAICLVEDMVSRHHAKLEISASGLVLTDLNSTNGTFVNGERIAKCEIEADDRVLVGTSIMRLVDQNAEGSVTRHDADHAITRTSVALDVPQAAANETGGNDTMSGDLADVAIADLLQLLGGNGRTGEIRLSCPQASAKLTLHAGALHAIIWEPAPHMSPIKALCRVMQVTMGTFVFTACEPGAITTAGAFSGRLEEALIEATRQNDEAARLREPFGPGPKTLRWAQPLGGRLSDLTATSLDVLQALWDEAATLEGVLDAYAGPDSEMLTILHELHQNGFIQAAAV
jgi:hypothetical protein